MEFRTAIRVNPVEKSIDFNSGVALFGSCFSENIAKKIAHFQIPYFSNSHGILFNPLAIEGAIMDDTQKKRYTENDLVCHEGIWLSLNHHSCYSGTKKTELLDLINRSVEAGNAFLKRSTHLIISLGTAWIYTYQNKTIVANCHKIPQREFEKSLLSVEEITDSLTRIILNIRDFNPGLEIIFTLSPVRHLRDGFIENSVSKAHLLTAIHGVCKSLNTWYFPSYEMMMDDLRDYRFYNADMIHPNQVAIDYIWEHFRKTWIGPAIYPVMSEVDAVQRSLDHLPFNQDSKEHQVFLKNLSVKIDQLLERFPHMEFKKKKPTNDFFAYYLSYFLLFFTSGNILPGSAVYGINAILF